MKQKHSSFLCLRKYNRKIQADYFIMYSVLRPKYITKIRNNSFWGFCHNIFTFLRSLRRNGIILLSTVTVCIMLQKKFLYLSCYNNYLVLTISQKFILWKCIWKRRSILKSCYFFILIKKIIFEALKGGAYTSLIQTQRFNKAWISCCCFNIQWRTLYDV